MSRVLSLLVFFGAGWAAYRYVEIGRIMLVIPSIMVVTSIMVAAVLVRLNRGMPALEWKSIPPDDRMKLTAAIVGVARHYVGALILMGTILTAVLILASFGTGAVGGWPEGVRQGLSASLCGLLALSVYQMGFIVWRDLDIILLQKTLIDTMADSEKYASEVADAQERGKMIKSQLRSVPTTPPKAFGE